MALLVRLRAEAPEVVLLPAVPGRRMKARDARRDPAPIVGRTTRRVRQLAARSRWLRSSARRRAHCALLRRASPRRLHVLRLARVPALGGSGPWAAATTAAALREPAPAPEVAESVLGGWARTEASSFFQVHRTRRGQRPRSRVSTTRGTPAFDSTSHRECPALEVCAHAERLSTERPKERSDTLAHSTGCLRAGASTRDRL
jgi:hypothetical protein